MIPFTCAGGYLAGGDQRRVPCRDQPDPDPLTRWRSFFPVIIGARSCCDRGGSGGARRDAGDMADRAAGLSRFGSVFLIAGRAALCRDRLPPA